MKLIHDLEVLQVCASENVSDAAINAVDFCGRLAEDLGATVYISKNFPGNRSSFYQYDKREAMQTDLESALSWAIEKANRLLLVVGGEHPDKRLENTSASFVEVVMAPWHSEATLFAESGIAHLLGDPERAPICPAGNFAAGTIGYAAFCALVGVYLKKERLGKSDSATVLGPSAMSWVNWKAAAGGVTGREMKREGNQGLWPTLACKDGYAALVYNQKDWPSIIKMVDDERLADPKYADFTERSDCADEWLGILRDWAKRHTKDELNTLFFDHAVPSAAVLTPSDLLSDALMQHRDAFKIRELDNGEEQHLVQPSHRFVQSIKSEEHQSESSNVVGSLPLSGLRILDLGIITAGAGTGALLADMGAEVLKVESKTYPDPFRFWAGSDDSPLFKFNNRNKFGLDIDLKTESGKAQFLALVAEADVVVENFRRGVIQRMGFGLEELRKHNPKIVLASISGQGDSGPRSGHVTYGSTLEANSGMSSLMSYEDGVPYTSGYNLNYPDQTVCLYGAAAIALAVQGAERSNTAIHIDISQRDTAAFIMGPALELVANGSDDRPESIKAALSNSVFDGMVLSSDQAWIAVHIPDWQRLTTADPELSAVSSDADLNAWAGTRAAVEIQETLRVANCGAQLCLNGKAMFDAEANKGSGIFARTSTNQLVKGFPFKFAHSEMTIHTESPTVGEHNDRFLT